MSDTPQTTPNPSPAASTPGQPLLLSNIDPADVEFVAPSEAESKYGGPAQQALAGIEAFGRGGSLGVSDVLEGRLARYSPELFGPQARQGREEANPITAFAGNVLGGGALLAGTGGIAAPAEAGLAARGVTGLAGKALAYGAEGSAFGAGSAISDVGLGRTDLSLGDPQTNAEKILSQIGLGTAVGAGLGVLSQTVAAGRALFKGNPQIEEAAANATPGVAANEPIIDVPRGTVPKNLQEMNDAVENAKNYGGQEDINNLPQKPDAVASAAALNPEMQFPLTDMQLNSLNSQAERNEFKVMSETPGKAGDIIRNYQGAQKKELLGILDRTINDVAPGYTPTSDAQLGGQRLSDSLTEAVEGNRARLGPVFNLLKNTELADQNHLPGVMDYLTASPTESQPHGIPDLAQIFDTSNEGELAFKPFNGQMGIAKTTYNKVKDLVTDLQTNPTDFSGLRSLRERLGEGIDPLSDDTAAKQVTQLKAAMMDYIQDKVQEINPDLNVRDTMRQWAINEQNAKLVEKGVGAQIGAENFRSKAIGKPDEAILAKVFSNTEALDSVKKMLSPEKFKEAVADHLAIQRENFTKDGVFSSQRMSGKMKANQYSLNDAFLDNPAPLDKLNNTLTALRLFADDAPKNPSGTATTLLQALLNGGIDPIAHARNLLNYGKEQFAESALNAKINAKLAGTADSANRLNAVQGMVEKVTGQINSGAKEVFTNGVRGGFISGALQLSDEKFNKLKTKLQDFSSNPQNMMGHVADNTTHLYNAAPNITQALHTSMYNGVAYLTSKLPQPAVSLPLSPKWEPSLAQKSQFSQYYNAVNDPVGTLKLVRNGTLTNNHMEALQATSPGLLQEMRQKVLENFRPEKTKDLPYAQKLSLAKFLGQPLDENMTSAAVMSNQLALSSPPIGRQAAQSPPGGGKTTQKGLEKLGLSKRVETAGSRGNEDVG